MYVSIASWVIYINADNPIPTSSNATGTSNSGGACPATNDEGMFIFIYIL